MSAAVQVGPVEQLAAMDCSGAASCFGSAVPPSEPFFDLSPPSSPSLHLLLPLFFLYNETIHIAGSGLASQPSRTRVYPW